MKKTVLRKAVPALCIICLLCMTGAALAAGGVSNVTAYLSEKLHMTFNGAPFKPVEADGSELPALLYKDRTYLPVRAIAEKAGVYVDYDYDTAEVILRSENQLLNRANLVLHYLKYQDFGQLAQVISKDKGVVFSPYSYVESDAVKFSAEQISALGAADEFLWGAYDGSGEPIDMNVNDYFGRFVYDQDFINAPRIGKDTFIQTGNTVADLSTAFPDGHFVEFNFPGIDPQYEGFDWTSLRLVFEQTGDGWALVGVVHDCWTP